MIHDPMRQADIAHRLANLAKARRCGAKTRTGHPCRQAAVEGMGKVPNARRGKRLRRASGQSQRHATQGNANYQGDEPVGPLCSLTKMARNTGGATGQCG
jgi:hypothetical protein